MIINIPGIDLAALQPSQLGERIGARLRIAIASHVLRCTCSMPACIPATSDGAGAWVRTQAVRHHHASVHHACLCWRHSADWLLPPPCLAPAANLSSAHLARLELGSLLQNMELPTLPSLEALNVTMREFLTQLPGMGLGTQVTAALTSSESMVGLMHPPHEQRHIDVDRLLHAAERSSMH